MPFAQIFAPIVSATIVNVFLFAFFWRGSQLEKHTGRFPWYYSLGIIIYSVSLLTVLVSVKDKPVTGGVAFFGAATAAEAMGVVISWSLHGAFIRSRGYPRKDRALAMVFALFLAGGMLAATFFG